MSQIPNPNYSPATTAGKAAAEGGVVLAGATLGTLVGSIAVNALRQTGKAPWTPDMDGYAVTAAAGLLASVFAGAKKAARNIRKHRWIPVLAIMGLTLALSGCVTTTAPDGTRTVSVDPGAVAGTVDTAFASWERLESRRALLEAERERARRDRDAERVAIIEREIARLSPELERAAARLGELAGE